MAAVPVDTFTASHCDVVTHAFPAYAAMAPRDRPPRDPLNITWRAIMWIGGDALMRSRAFPSRSLGEVGTSNA